MTTPDKPNLGRADIFIPYAEQKTPVKVHTIRFAVSPYMGDPESEIPELLGINAMPCCRTALRSKTITHDFGWGDNPRLSCIVQNILVVQCDCGVNSYMNRQQAPTIQRLGKLIGDLIEFPDLEGLKWVQTFLSETDIKKVVEFMESVSREPYLADRKSYLRGLREVKKFT